jgi:predicted RNase H-like HicB family nuclease
MHRLTAYIEKDKETNLLIAVVPGVSGAHTQVETLDELRNNLQEALELCLEEMDPESRDLIPEFIGIQQIEVEI